MKGMPPVPVPLVLAPPVPVPAALLVVELLVPPVPLGPLDEVDEADVWDEEVEPPAPCEEFPPVELELEQATRPSKAKRESVRMVS